jgi:hypothetical protein
VEISKPRIAAKSQFLLALYWGIGQFFRVLSSSRPHALSARGGRDEVLMPQQHYTMGAL